MKYTESMHFMLTKFSLIVAAWYAESVSIFCSFVFLCVGHAVIEIDELWQRVSRR